MNRLWVTGYRAYELGVFTDKDPKIAVIRYALTNYLTNLLEQGQLDWVITGANLGIEQWAVEAALALKEKYPLRVSIMLPYKNFASRWNEHNQAKFTQLTNAVDFCAYTSNQPYKSPTQLRNYQNFMLTHTDQALMVYDEEHPGKAKYDYAMIKEYQTKQPYELTLIDFYDLQDSAQDFQENYHDQQEDNYEN